MAPLSMFLLITSIASSLALNCGGIAGKPCPAGYSCVDVPNDGCDPLKGGRDCPGKCQKTVPTVTTLEGSKTCGGIAGKRCDAGYVCVDDPNDACDPNKGGRDCPGICQKKPGSCGGLVGKPCPSGYQCVDDPEDDCPSLGADCPGICVQRPQSCGGKAGGKCPADYACVDDRSDGCDPTQGGMDCPKICVKRPQFCGGIGNIQCPKGEQCIDNPGDNCDPTKGGRDCGGICVAGSATEPAAPPRHTAAPCGGIAGLQCAEGYHCVGSDAFPDAQGLCIKDDPETPNICGGIGGFQCRKGYHCEGGSTQKCPDCAGTCVKDAVDVPCQGDCTPKMEL